jgi:phosphoribosylformylglycinamidine synthase subunit PurSL
LSGLINWRVYIAIFLGQRKVTFFQIEVQATAERYDVQAQRLIREIAYLPEQQLPSLKRISADTEQPLFLRTAQLYRLSGKLTPLQLDQLTTQLLVDTVVQQATYEGVSITDTPSSVSVVDVFFLPGVTDTLAESVLVGASMLGITGLEWVETGRRYVLDGRLSEAEVRTIAESLLYNPVIQQYELHLAHENFQGRTKREALTPGEGRPQGPQPHIHAITSPPERVPAPTQDPLPVGTMRAADIPISDMNDAQLLEVSRKGLLSLNLEEMQAIQQHYRGQGREPTDVELETLAQTWSEHCSHKTFKATIHYREQDSHGAVLREETIAGLLKEYVMRATEQVEQPWVVSAFSDNAGIIRFTEAQDIAFKVETHNHPSAIEPFGGANTGVGGVIRDVLGVSAQPIACTDVLCFGPLDTPVEDLPAGVLAPRRIASGVVNGVRDYGNKMGIPTVNGAILYNEGYLYNPLVFCGCLGILPHGSHPRSVQVGDRIVVLGGSTGRDGIHGATFSSAEMSSEITALAGSAVQIGAPITEKKVADVIVQARDRGLYSAITDCGAGGFSSAIGEMGAETGANVELEKAPLKYQGLAPWEIWLSEAQERMVLAVPAHHLEELLELCEIEEVEASVIGRFTDDHRLTVTYQGQMVASMDMEFLHNGRPGRTLEALWTSTEVVTNLTPTRGVTTSYPPPDEQHVVTPLVGVRPSFSETLLALLRHPTIASKEAVVRRYDHEVQGATVLKPLVGRSGNGPGDAAVLQPILNEPTTMGIVLSNGINPLYSKRDPYHMAVNAVDEALRNLTAVGGDIERAAILDNFCWGNPNDPEQLGMLVRAVKGCYDAAIGFGVPFISGKDSLNNEYRTDGKRWPVIPTLLISAVGVIEDVAQTVDMSLKAPGNLLYLIGRTRDELAGSHYAEVVGQAVFEHFFPYTAVPEVNISHGYDIMKAVGLAIRKGLVCSCHDISEGGLAVALAEMVIAGSLLQYPQTDQGNGKKPGSLPPPVTLSDASHSTRTNPNRSSVLTLGVQVDLGNLPPQDIFRNVGNIVRLFSESASRFIVEVAPDKWENFEKHMHAHNVWDVKQIGRVTDTGYVHIYDLDELIYVSVADLQEAWKGGTV